MTNPWSLHHILRSLHFIFYKAAHAPPLQLAATIAGTLFALAFFVIGMSRVVEFQDLGFKRAKIWIFSGLHMIGVTLFTTAMVLFSADEGRSQLELTSWLLLPALAILLPLHIYINIIRRVRLADALSKRV